MEKPKPKSLSQKRRLAMQMTREEKIKGIWDSIVPDLIEKYFPKEKCKERGEALVLIARIYCEVLPKLNTLYNSDREKWLKSKQMSECPHCGKEIK